MKIVKRYENVSDSGVERTVELRDETYTSTHNGVTVTVPLFTVTSTNDYCGCHYHRLERETLDEAENLFVELIS